MIPSACNDSATISRSCCHLGGISAAWLVKTWKLDQADCLYGRLLPEKERESLEVIEAKANKEAAAAAQRAAQTSSLNGKPKSLGTEKSSTATSPRPQKADATSPRSRPENAHLAAIPSIPGKYMPPKKPVSIVRGSIVTLQSVNI